MDSRRIHLVVDFGVERHTLVTREISQIFHQSSAAVTQVAAARAHLFRVRAQLLRRLSELTCPIQGESRDSLPTQLRGRQGKAHLLPDFSSDSDIGIIWGAFSRLGSATLLADTFGVPE